MSGSVLSCQQSKQKLPTFWKMNASRPHVSQIILSCFLFLYRSRVLQQGQRIAFISKYFWHLVQYLRPNAYGPGDAKQGYEIFPHNFLHCVIILLIGHEACYNAAITKGRGRVPGCCLITFRLNNVNNRRPYGKAPALHTNSAAPIISSCSVRNNLCGIELE
jgi:hypothetical protein